MGLFKADFYRSLAIGFALGAVLTFATMGGSAGTELVNGMLPSAVAAPVQ